MNKKIVLLDMDGVLTDFVGSSLKIIGKENLVITQENMALQLGITDEEFQEVINAEGESFWAEMTETPDCNQILDLVESTGCPWLISTNPGKFKYATAGKEMWIRTKFGNDFEDYMIGKHKYLMAGRDRILIDDYTKNCSKFRMYGGQAILVPRPYNPLCYLNTMSQIKLVLNSYLQ